MANVNPHALTIGTPNGARRLQKGRNAGTLVHRIIAKNLVVFVNNKILAPTDWFMKKCPKKLVNQHLSCVEVFGNCTSNICPVGILRLG